MSIPNLQSGPPTISPLTYMWVAIWEAAWVIGGCLAFIMTDAMAWLLAAIPIGTAPIFYVLIKHLRARAEHQKGERPLDIVR